MISYQEVFRDTAKMTGEFFEEQPWEIGQIYYHIDDYQDGLPVVVEVEIVDVSMRCTISAATGEVTDKRFIYDAVNSLGEKTRVRYVTPENSFVTREEASRHLQKMLRDKLMIAETYAEEYTEEVRMLRSALEN